VAVDTVRNAAVDVLLRVFEKGAFLDVALDRTLKRGRLSERGRRFLTHLVYGAVRHKLLCDFVLTDLVHQPLDDLPRPILAVLRMGVYQALFCDQVTFPAMVHTSVDLAKRRGHAGTAKLVNAVLRRAPRSLGDVELPPPDDPVQHLSVRHSMPGWMVEQWIHEHGEETARTLCEAFNEQAPVTLRANLLRTTPEDLCAGLTKAGYPSEQRTPIPEEVTVVGGAPPTRAKLFQRGCCIIQDPAAMLPAHLLEPQPGDWVLDLCAAPGGKTTHLGELAHGKARILATDAHVRKLRLVAENVERLGTPNVWVACADGVTPPFTRQFDRVLVDAPCSGLGTLRRHPDLKWRAGPHDFETLAVRQEALLRSAVGLCKNGGVVVYAVCAFSRRETVQVIESILKTLPVEPENGPEWLSQWQLNVGQYRTLPQQDGLDGFFLTRLRKRP